MSGTIYRIELTTRHFHFEAFAGSIRYARAAMERAILIHCGTYKVDHAEFLREYRASIEVKQFTLGEGYRDGERITGKKSDA